MALKVLLHATGEGRKLWPLTSELPSPMLPVLNRPVMSYAIETLKRQQVKDITVSIYEHPWAIEAYFGEGLRWGVHLDYRLQRQGWKDAGALRWAFPQPESTLLIFPADILFDLDLEAALEAHRQQGAAITVVQASRESISGDDSQLQAAGVYLLEAGVLALVPSRTSVAVGEELVLQLKAKGWVIGNFVSRGYFNPLSNFEQYYSAPFELISAAGGTGETKLMDEKQACMLRSLNVEGHLIAPGIWVGRNNLIHPTAQLTPPVYLHTNNRIGSRARVGPYVVMSENNIVGEEATLERSVLVGDSFVGQLVDVNERIVYRNLLVDPISGAHVYLPDPFLLADARPQVIVGTLERIFDFGAALLTVVLLSPLFLFCALLIWLSGVPVFQIEECLHIRKTGQDSRHRTFRRIRFNTRRLDGSASRIHKLLQLLELHRLPEWFNVLRGEMSVVGVKPLPVADADPKVGIQPFTEEWQRRRFTAPAGLTGLWYLQTSPSSSLEEVLVTDAYYLATRSTQGNVRILLQTPLTWLRHMITRGRSDDETSVQSN